MLCCYRLYAQIGKPEILSYFSLYFVAVGFVVLGVFQRIRILKVSTSVSMLCAYTTVCGVMVFS
jgi:hypothetical protein